MVIRRIVCPIDFSPDSRVIVRGALAIARQERAKVTVLHVLEPLLAQAAALAAERDWLTQRTYEELDKLLQRAVEESDIDPRAIDRQVRSAEPDEGILAAAGECGADLIVMGTEARRGVRRMFLWIDCGPGPGPHDDSRARPPAECPRPAHPGGRVAVPAFAADSGRRRLL